MVTLFSDRRMLDHVPPARHPERPERLQAILRHLDRTGLAQACPQGHVREATTLELSRVHEPGYIEELAQAEARGARHVEADTWINPGSCLAARLAAGAAVEAVAAVVEGAEPRALCLVRPPGHHARPGEPMGFCLFDNVAVAAADAVERL